jgi:integrase
MSVRKLRNGKWQAIINDKEVFGDERPSKCFDTQREAKDWVTAHTDEWKYRKGMADKRNATVGQLAEAYKCHLDDRVDAGDIEASTRRLLWLGVRVHILPRWGHVKCENLGTDMVQAFVRECGKHNGRALNTVRSLFDMVGVGVRKGYFDRSPFERDPLILPPRNRRADEEMPSAGELHRLLEIVQSPLLGLPEIDALYDEAFVRLGMHQGLRHGEVCGLLRPEACREPEPDIDFANNVIHVRRSFCNVTKKLKSTKSENGIRTIGMTEPVREIMEEITALPANGSSGLLFVSPRGAPYYQKLGYRWAHLMMRAGLLVPDEKGSMVPKFVFHSLRHVLGSYLLAKGVPIPKCARLLGHSIMTFTKTYMREIEDRDHALEELDEVARWIGDGATALLSSPESALPLRPSRLLLDANANKTQRRPGKWWKS